MALDFLILYEHVVREYESLLLLKQELNNRGFTVEIRQLLDRKKLKYFTFKKPKVLVSSNMYDNEGINSHVYNNIGRCDKIVNLHWEQMLSDTQEEEEWFNFSGNAKKCVQTCWGELTRQRLIEHGVPPENAVVTGAVMMDFVRPEFEGYFKNKKQLCTEHNINPNNRLLLYVSSFGYASMEQSEVDEISKMAGTDFTEFARVNRLSMADTLNWFDEYLPKHKDEELVYRRHPSEWNCPALSDMQARHSNFHVIFEDSVKQWIVAADDIFIWMSTAIAEVYFAGKNCHILRPQPIPHEFDPVIYAGGRYITNYEDFAGAVASVEAKFPIDTKRIEGYFDNSTTPAYIRMVDLLARVHSEPSRDKPFSKGYTPKFNLVKFIALAGVHFMDFIHLDPAKFSKICPPFASFAGRIYGYIQKSKISKAEVTKIEKKIKKIIF